MSDPVLPWWVKPALAFVVLGLFGYAEVRVLDDADSQYKQLMLACIIGLVTGALGFYFGSSAGSDKKDSAIAANTAALAASAPLDIVVPPTEPSDAVKALAARVPTA